MYLLDMCHEMPFLFKALLMNETSNHYYQMVMTEMEELDLAQDPCVGDEQYDFKVSHVLRQSVPPKNESKFLSSKGAIPQKSLIGDPIIICFWPIF